MKRKLNINKLDDKNTKTISIDKYKNNEYNSTDIEPLYNIVEMIINPEYRKKIRDYYDDIYKEAKEEKEIFETMNRRRLNLNKLKDKLSTKTISSNEALKDIIPFEWSDEVLNGKKKIIINLSDESEE